MNFFKNLEKLLTDDTDYVLEIAQNPLVTRIDLDKLNSSSASLVIKDNPKLDMSKYCDKIDGMLNGNRVIVRNKVDCAARLHRGLEIKLNGYLENLGLTKLVRIDTKYYLQIANNRILQISFDEMELFAASNMAVDWLWGFYPTEDLPPHICKFNSTTDDISVIHENCTAILGLLYYRGRSFTALELQKFQHTKIYGNIDLAAMDIEDLSMFSNLQKIISLNGTLPAFPAIALDFLPGLTSIRLPSLRSIYAPTQYKFNIDNCPELKVRLDDCNFFETLMHEPVIINYHPCDLWYNEKMKPVETESFI